MPTLLQLLLFAIGVSRSTTIASPVNEKFVARGTCSQAVGTGAALVCSDPENCSADTCEIDGGSYICNAGNRCHKPGNPCMVTGYSYTSGSSSSNGSGGVKVHCI